MRNFKSKEYQVMEALVGMTQAEVMDSMEKLLKNKYGENVIRTKDYIIANGSIPVALVAHMDTVFTHPVLDLYYDPRKNVMWSPDGLGADDRAGLFAIIQILTKTDLRPHIILTTEEERGGLGAAALVKDCPTVPFGKLNYIIELDRQGSNDCVFYDCYNPEFIHYVEQFGFVERHGSFSDISFICPQWKIAGVNLSVGYFDEHSYRETLNVGMLLSTIGKVTKMLKDADNIPIFEYKELFAGHKNWYSQIDYPEDDIEEVYLHCHKCNRLFYDYEMFPVKGLDGHTHFYCPDCMGDNRISWCDTCQEAYERPEGGSRDKCPDCEQIEQLEKSSNDINRAN